LEFSSSAVKLPVLTGMVNNQNGSTILWLYSYFFGEKFEFQKLIRPRILCLSSRGKKSNSVKTKKMFLTKNVTCVSRPTRR
jgi:hypothetical protein